MEKVESEVSSSDNEMSNGADSSMIGPVASMIKFKKDMTYEDFLEDPF